MTDIGLNLSLMKGKETMLIYMLLNTRLKADEIICNS